MRSVSGVGAKNPPPPGKPHLPGAAGPQQRRDPGTDEGAVAVVAVEPSARGDGEARVGVEFTLHEDRGNGMVVVHRAGQGGIAELVGAPSCPDEPRTQRPAPQRGEFHQPGEVPIRFFREAPGPAVPPRGQRGTASDLPALPERPRGDHAGVELVGGEPLHERDTIGRGPPIECPTPPPFNGGTADEEQRGPAPVGPPEPGPQHQSVVAGYVGEAVPVDVAATLVVSPRQERVPPPPAGGARGEGHGVGTAECGGVEEQVGARLRIPRNQVDDATHGGRAVERGRGTLDQLDLGQVHRRNLEGPQPADLRPVEGKAVGEDSGIATPKALDPDRGAA